MNDAFSRTRILLGEENLEKIFNSSVTIAGLGAVGSFATEALARIGVGTLNIIDFDKICPSNINRQLFATYPNEGILKTTAAKDRILSINPKCKVNVFSKEILEDNLDEFFPEKPDVLIDAIDSVKSKIALLAYAKNIGQIEILSSMGAARKTDISKLQVADISKTSVCPLAQLVRKSLKKMGIYSGIKCVFSTQSPLAKSDETSFCTQKTLGSIITITGSFGLILANEAISKIIKKEV